MTRSTLRGPGGGAPGWLADRGLAVDDGLHVLRAVAVPQGGGPKPGRLILAGDAKGDYPAPAMHHLDARRLHAVEEVGKVGGALRKSRVDGPADLLFVGGGRASPSHWP